MEKNFKVGDRVRHEEYGTGTVDYVNNDHGRCNVILDDNDVLANVSSDDLELIEPAPTAAPTPDRAMIAAKLLRTFVKKYSMLDAEDAAKKSVEFTDALIAELQRTEK